MVTLQEVEYRLAKVGLHNRYWGKPELRELTHIIMSDEQIVGAVNGRYEGGFALLVATDRRVLLVDKKPIFLNMLDIGYATISDIRYTAKLIDATVWIRTSNKSFSFTSMRQKHLRQLASHLQEKVMNMMQRRYSQLASLSTYNQDGEADFSALGSRALAGNLSGATPIHLLPPHANIRQRAARYYPTPSTY